MWIISNDVGIGGSAGAQRACTRIKNGQPHRIIHQVDVSIQDLPSD